MQAHVDDMGTGRADVSRSARWSRSLRSAFGNDSNRAVGLVRDPALRARDARPRGRRTSGSRRPGRDPGRAPRVAGSRGHGRARDRERDDVEDELRRWRWHRVVSSAASIRARKATTASSGTARAVAPNSSIRSGSWTAPGSPSWVRTTSVMTSRQIASRAAAARRRSAAGARADVVPDSSSPAARFDDGAAVRRDPRRPRAGRVSSSAATGGASAASRSAVRAI